MWVCFVWQAALPGAIPLPLITESSGCWVSPFRPVSPLFSQPGRRQDAHINGELSADGRWMWGTEHRYSQPQITLDIRPPGSWITGIRHHCRPATPPVSTSWLNRVMWEQQKYLQNWIR